ncbi:c-type cytochrome biogenesis protein CcsB [Rothia sp. (in: high G+C Gram-positive bacteria)]|uniref:c-type cytochrome biogenesis protein CcsB n=1 Tax=Rothia sp. (in: high G+C Gram-positive bacteria) TaxID=1885016 RepID=UPI003217F230
MPEISENLAQWSELFMYLAAVTYMVAFISFAWDIASNSRTTLRLEETQVRERELVGAGARAGSAKSARISGTEQGTGVRGMSYKRSAAKKIEAHVADAEMRYTGERRPAARAAVIILALGALIHGAGVLTRALAANRVPWGNMYEFCTTGAFLVVLVYLIALIFRDLRFVGVLVSGLALTMMTAATIGFPTPVGQLKPALQSYWLVIHVSIAVLASAIFTITFAMAILQLVQTSRERQIITDQSTQLTRLGFMRLIPSSTALENFAFRLNAVGFVMWTFTLAAGAIWAEKAWGRYWGWDTKEVWTFIIWVVYAAYLHARATRGWSGPPSAWLSITGYLCIIFNFTVVNVYFSGLHSYSGL